MFLLFEIETGLPYGFATTLVISGLVAVVLPLLFVVLGKRLGLLKRVVPAYLIYYFICVLTVAALSRFVL